MVDFFFLYHKIFISTFLVSFCLSLLIISTKKFHINFTSRGHSGKSGIQNIHKIPTPRLGGIAIIIAFFIFHFLIEMQNKEIYYTILFSSLIIFMVGIIDDFGFIIKPIWRLMFSAVASLIMVFYTGLWLQNISTPILEQLMQISFFAIFFTVFAVTGVVHSFNLIDGLNGLSLGISIIIGMTLCTIALYFEDTTLALFSIGICICAIGILVLNFPFGLIFLGDSGSHILGYFLAWNAIILIHKYPEISAWSILLCFFWPVMETLFSIYRRLLDKVSTNTADLRHFHHLIFTILIRNKIIKFENNVANPLASFLILNLAGLPCIMSLIFFENIIIIVSIVFIFTTFYLILYRYIESLLISINSKKKPDKLKF